PRPRNCKEYHRRPGRHDHHRQPRALGDDGAHHPAGSQRRRSRAMTRGSILLVDDEPKIRQALTEALRDEGHTVSATGNPHEALRLVGQRPFDLLVVDNLMPELSGLELIREVVSASGNGADHPQILMMTAHATVESAIEAMKLGALDYLQ